MDRRRPIAPLPVLSIFGMDVLATTRQRYAALGICAALVSVALCAAVLGRAAGPELLPFVPVTATVCALADVLTGFLLLAQFYISGKTSLAVIAVAYGFSALMSLSFLAYFPGIFRTGALTLGDEQLSSVVWWLWHCTFPLLVAYAACSHSTRRIVSRRTIRHVTCAAAITPLVAVSAISIIAFLNREALPHLIVHGVFTPAYRFSLLPLAVVLNAFACCVLLIRNRKLSPLSLWLAVATFSAALEALMVNLSSARYSYAWDAGKLITVFTASIVLLMMLSDIVGLYGRLASVARIDVLTSLLNRRGYEERFDTLYLNARRLGGSLALLVVDVDFFKRYNDSYGHLAGDECLRWVARALEGCATRPLDVLARYGGEEFVIVLPDTPLRGALFIAERIRAAVEGLDIVLGTKLLGGVTVSIGVAHVPNARSIDRSTLFETADRAVYRAKAGGRNRVFLGTSEPRERDDEARSIELAAAVSDA